MEWSMEGEGGQVWTGVFSAESSLTKQVPGIPAWVPFAGSEWFQLVLYIYIYVLKKTIHNNNLNFLFISHSIAKEGELF